MVEMLKALFYAFIHNDPVYITVVRRYVDAQNHYIGELYLGEGRESKMIGMSCDSLPFEVGQGRTFQTKLCWRKDFLEPLENGIIRVGGIEPEFNSSVQAAIALRRFCKLRVTILNRFIEYIMEPSHG